MTTREELRIRVQLCIARKQEGESWDFKRQWYCEDEKGSLLHDIICMSNLITDEDGIIIIGVDEEKDYEIVDISGDGNRKNTHEMVKFLRDKPFDGGIRPMAHVESFVIDKKTIDVIVIENTTNTPYYLIERFRNVEPYHIYTRIGDSNTPIDKSADRDRVEALWRKRFGIHKTTLDRFVSYLKDCHHWRSVDGQQSWYYEYAPEFRIETELDENSDAYNYYCFTQLDSRPSYYSLRILYHTTIVIDTLAIVLDGGRFITAVPNVHMFGFVPYYYYRTDSINSALNHFFSSIIYDNTYSITAFDSWNSCVPTIGNEEESEEFFKWIKYQKIPKDTDRKIPPIPDKLPNGEDGERYKEEYKHAMIINDMLELYWEQLFR